MKIKALRLKNWVEFEDFEIVFNDDITHLVGINGSGKTTIGLNAIWAGFKGIAEKSKDALIGDRYRFIASGKKSLDIIITLHDEINDLDITLKRHITKDLNQISISSDHDQSLSKDYVENLLNVTFLSASHFTNLSGKEQALALGINTSEFDKFISELKSDAQLLRKQIKIYGELPEIEKIEKVSVSDLIIERDAIIGKNKIQADLQSRLTLKRDALLIAERAVIAAQQKVNDLQEEISEIEIPTGEIIDTIELDKKIGNAEETNEKALAYIANVQKVQEKKKITDKLEANISSQESKKAERLKYIKSSSLGLKGLTVDETGSLLMNEKPIKSPYFSKGELEMIVANIASGLNPDLKVRFVDDFEMLDEENQRKIIKGLSKRGFQIITATVGDKKVRDNSVLLRQCKIVDN
jgi:hypothetical protein